AGGVGGDGAARAARLGQRHPAHLGWEAVREHAVEEALRAGPGHDELRQARLDEHAHARANASALVADGVEPVGAAERVLVAGRPVSREPERTLPAEALAEDGAAAREPVVDRVDFERAPCRELLLRV